MTQQPFPADQSPLPLGDGTANIGQSIKTIQPPPSIDSNRTVPLLLAAALVCIAVFLGMAGVPANPSPVAGNGSDALRQGWASERCLHRVEEIGAKPVIEQD